MRYFIYQLIDPRDQVPRYVGFTSDLRRRLRQHRSGTAIGDQRNAQKQAWIQELQRQGLEPVIQRLETLEGRVSDAIQRETYWMQRLIQQGVPLLNGDQRKRGAQAFERTHKRFSFWLDKDLKARFEALADVEGVSKSALFDEAVTDLLAKYQV